jgi:hypothetical protein
VNQLCPRCGAVFPPDVSMGFVQGRVPCGDCGLAFDDPPDMLAPSGGDDDQIAYDLVEWPAEDRVIATDDLVELDISYRWEDGLVLVVPAAVEEQVDAVLDEIDENALSDDDELIDIDVGDGDDRGEEAADAMGDLFVAADALQHARYDEEKVVEFIEAAAAVASSLTPYGVEPQVWARIQNEASAIVAALEKGGEGDEDESVGDAARSLRELLRHYV